MLPAALLLSACAPTKWVEPTPDVAQTFQAGSPARSDTGPFWLNFRDNTLNKLITQGHERNLSIHEALAAIDEAQAALGTARSGGLPSASLNGAAQSGDVQGDGRTGTQSSAGVSASWLLDLFGANRAARAAAVAELEATELGAQTARLAVAAAITNAYIDLRFHQEHVALTRKGIASQRETLKMTQSMFDLGQAGRLDVLQAEQAMKQSEAALPKRLIALDQAVNRLATLTNQRSADILALAAQGRAQPVPLGQPSVGLPAEVVRERPDIKIAERRLAAAVARIGVAEAAFWPSVTVSGSIVPTRIGGQNTITPWQCIDPAESTQFMLLI